MAFEEQLLGLINTHGIWGLFFATALSSTSILFPLPVSLLIITGTQLFGALASVLVGALGASLGEFSTYVLFREGRLLLKEAQRKNIDKFEKSIDKWGFWAIFVSACLPYFPVDAASVAAGVLKYDAAKYIIAIILGRIVYFSFLAYTSQTILNGTL